MFGPSLRAVNAPLLWPLLTSARRRLASLQAVAALAGALPPPTAGQTSPGKGNNLRSMSPPHLLRQVPDSCRALFCHANSPTCRSLLMRFLSVGAELCRRLPSDPASRLRPCLELTLLAIKRVEDFHLQVIAHAGHTCKSPFSAEAPNGLCPFVLLYSRVSGL
jgi:hypothetical protein